jgi:ketosteroid isomerase-like protein
MSLENVELARRVYDAINRRDLDAFLALMDEDVKAHSRLAAMEGGVYRGHEGSRRWWHDLLEMIPDYTIEVEELRDLGDVTLARFRARGHGAASNAPVVDAQWQPVRWRDGKCVWWSVCSTEAEALDAAGLRE